MKNESPQVSMSNIINAPFAASKQSKRNLFARIFRALQNWQHRRIAIRELNALPDVLLRDIGIERHQIKAVVMGSAPRAKVHPLNTPSQETATHKQDSEAAKQPAASPLQQAA